MMQGIVRDTIMQGDIIHINFLNPQKINKTLEQIDFNNSYYVGLERLNNEDITYFDVHLFYVFNSSFQNFSLPFIEELEKEYNLTIINSCDKNDVINMFKIKENKFIKYNYSTYYFNSIINSSIYYIE